RGRGRWAPRRCLRRESAGRARSGRGRGRTAGWPPRGRGQRGGRGGGGRGARIRGVSGRTLSNGESARQSATLGEPGVGGS
ncbi:MAG: hypothetical protein FJ397_14345, partial [Verrucomicrobia bacterium]|nr:hypothetical protein [Verrucomicrobiota bacterium]